METIKKIINWIINLFRKDEEEDWEVEESSKNLDIELEKKLKIIYTSEQYKISKQNIYEEFEEFKKEHSEKIGKFYDSEWGTFKVTGIKEPWFLKSPMLKDECNFYWSFDEMFIVIPLDNFEIDSIPINELEDYCTEISKDSIVKMSKKFVENTKGEEE